MQGVHHFPKEKKSVLGFSEFLANNSDHLLSRNKFFRNMMVAVCISQWVSEKILLQSKVKVEQTKTYHSKKKLKNLKIYSN